MVEISVYINSFCNVKLCIMYKVRYFFFFLSSTAGIKVKDPFSTKDDDMM